MARQSDQGSKLQYLDLKTRCITTSLHPSSKQPLRCCWLFSSTSQRSWRRRWSTHCHNTFIDCTLLHPEESGEIEDPHTATALMLTALFCSQKKLVKMRIHVHRQPRHFYWQHSSVRQRHWWNKGSTHRHGTFIDYTPLHPKERGWKEDPQNAMASGCSWCLSAAHQRGCWSRWPIRRHSAVAPLLHVEKSSGVGDSLLVLIEIWKNYGACTKINRHETPVFFHAR